ncbi:MAG TPA: type IV toxin-antitoxin system AbiEi family antitoxin domain-containing protein, partial [Solirubrobacterales bacterium]|nr:type IV toxin-antitoxin system AbiEi family antitoxin domain-containing protein [Solirubrobacterales bacterium]
PPHHRLARLSGRRHGIVTRGQMLRLGYSKSAIGRAVKSGRLHPVHRGVYAVGRDDLSDHGRCIAAVAAYGAEAMLSHRSAAWLWGLLHGGPRNPDVSVPWRGRAQPRPGTSIHHAPALTETDRTEREGIPVTSLPRTLLDLASCPPAARLGPAIERAERMELFDLRAMDELLGRTRGHPGRGRLRRALGAYREPGFTRSALERRFLRLVREAGLPRPATNLFLAGYELDAYWERERFAVELDTYEFHGGQGAFERDRLRQEDLLLAGIAVDRITGWRLDREPVAVMKRLRRLLEQRRREVPPPRPDGAQ